MKGLAITAALLLAGPARADSATSCGAYPDEVANGYAGCILRKAGERPLWRRPLKRGVVQELRFTFTEGHLAYAKVIHVIQRLDGRASIRLLTLRRERKGDMSVSIARTRRLSRQEMAMIDRLGSSSGTWGQRVRSWDGGELFLHCETLDMERATRDSYSFSSVSISCNQPKPLMPLVNFVTAIVGLKPYADCQMF